MTGLPGRSGPPGNRNSVKHGYYSLIKLVRSRHGALDKRTILGKMVIATMHNLESDLGGADNLSTAQRMLIQDVAIDTLLLQALQARLDVAPIRKGKIHPVYTLRAQLIAQRREHLKLLGLKRISKEISLSDYVSEKYGEHDGKSRSNLHANKTAAIVPVEQKDSDA